MRHLLIPAATLVAATLTSASFGAITAGLQGYYKLDESSNAAGTTVTNSGSVAENGTIVNVAAAGSTGIVGTAYTLEDGLSPGANDAGTTANVNLTPAASTIVDNLAVQLTSTGAATADTTGVNRASISMWIRPTDNKAPTTGAAGRSNLIAGTTDFQFALQNTAGSGTGSAASSDTAADLLFNFRNATGTNIAANTDNNAAGISVPVGASAPYTHVAMTRDGGTISLFINGVLVTQATGLSTDSFYYRAFDNDGDTIATDNNLLLGTTAGSSGATRDFDGDIDDVGIFVDRAVTPTEISAIAGLGRFSHAGLDNTGIDAVLAVFANQTGSATVGGITYTYATFNTTSQLLGSHFQDGSNFNIILGGTSGAFTGVTGVAAVPEPATISALAAGAAGMLRRRRR